MRSEVRSETRLKERRRLAVLTTGRHDWGILRSTCRLLQADAEFSLCLLVGGMHTDARYGETGALVASDGFVCDETLAWMRANKRVNGYADRRAQGSGKDESEEEPECSPQAQAGAAVALVADALHRQQPEALLLVGDRFEVAGAALGATLARIPIVHLHGGEETAGAFDNAFRHAITKLSHLHLVSHPEHAARVVAMGEDPESVCCVGAPGLDNLHRTDLPDRSELETRLGSALCPPLVLVTLHPATLGGDPACEAAALCAAMTQVKATYLLTLPNADPGGAQIRAALRSFGARPNAVVVGALGERRYWGAMRLADAMLGNSSSALIEAPVLGLPAVNIGDRQKGRVRGGNVLDVPADTDAIVCALRQALSPAFRERARRSPSPFGEGRSGEKVVEVLRSWTPPRPPIKPPVPIRG